MLSRSSLALGTLRPHCGVGAQVTLSSVLLHKASMEGSRNLHTSAPSHFVDYHHPTVQAVAQELLLQGGNESGEKTKLSEAERAKRAYYFVRDSIRYDPYTFVDFMDDSDKYKASNILANHRNGAFCHLKSIAFAALTRALGLKSKVGLCLVKNHLDTTALREALATNEYFHGYAGVEVDGKWLKVSPTFDAKLCHKFQVKPLEFDGTADATFHEYDAVGRKHMEYIKDYGMHYDFPYGFYLSKIQQYHGSASVEKLREARRMKRDKFAATAVA